MKDCTMTAGTMHVLLWHYFSPEPYPVPTKIHNDIIADLTNDNLLYLDEAGILRPTERGFAYVEMLLTTPLPQQRWVDARFEDYPRKAGL